MYLFGGEHEARVPIDNKTYVLDADGASWSVAHPGCDDASTTAPPPRIAHGQASIGDNLYIFGGRQGITMEEAPLSDLWAFNILSNTWSLIDEPPPPAPSSGGEGGKGTSNPRPVERSFHRMVAKGSNLYVFGGCAACGRLADLHCFNTVSKEWTELAAPDLAGRGGPGFACLPDTDDLVVIGGFAGKETNDVHRYDCSANAWIQVEKAEADLRPRSVFPCQPANNLVKGAIVLFGGEVSPSDAGHSGAGGFANDVVVVNPAAGNETPAVSASLIGDKDSSAVPRERGWTSMCPAPTSLLGGGEAAAAAAVSTGSASFVLFGGLAGDDANPERLGDTWLLTVEAN